MCYFVTMSAILIILHLILVYFVCDCVQLLILRYAKYKKDGL